jgi:tetratricopeptide (TPR) repeat protein
VSLTVSFLIDELVSRKSPELPRVLSSILSQEELGRGSFSAESLSNLVDAFRNPIITSNLQVRFYLAAMKKAREKLNSGDMDLQNEYNLISAILPDISANAQNLVNDAMTLKVLLNSAILHNSTEYDLAFDRIQESSDKLAATISEAEATENKSLKAELFIDAVNMALMNGKPQVALDTLEKLAEIRRGEKGKIERFYSWYDQCLGDIVALALKANNVDLGKIASDKVVDKLTRAANLRKIAEYYFEKQDLDSASDTLKKSLKTANDTDNSSRKIGVLLRLILAFHKIDKAGVSGVVEVTAKCIDSIPTLGPEDKPETEKYKQYIGSIMAIDINIMPIFTELLKTNRTEALNLASRVNKKEVKIIANYTLMVDSLTSLKIEISKK